MANREDRGWKPSGARLAHVQQEVELGGGGLDPHARLPARPQSLQRFRADALRQQGVVAGAQALGAGVGRVAELLQGGPCRLAQPRGRSRSQRQRATERLAAVREGGVDERHHGARRPGRVPAQRHEHRVHPRLGAEHGARHPAHDLHRAGELGQHRGRAVALAPRRGREALAHLALDHGQPEVGGGHLLHRSQEDRRRDAVGQVGHHLAGRGIERREVEPHGVGQVQGGVGEGREGVAQRRLQGRVDLHHVHVPCSRGEVLREHAEAPAHLEHHVAVRELGRASRSPRAGCRRSGSSVPARRWGGPRSA